MTGEDLLKGLSYINGKLVEEAETGSLSDGKKRVQPMGSRRTLKKGLLIAAVIAVMLLLVGCAVVYVLHMQDLKVGEQTGFVYAADGDKITAETVAVDQQILTLGGAEGSPAYMAAKEWFDFKESYDPDHLIQVKLAQEKQRPEFPEEYDAYNIYTQEMKDKLDEIVEKYDLKLAGTYVESRTFKQLCKAVGMETILSPGCEDFLRVTGGSYYECGNMDLSFNVSLQGEAGTEPVETWGALYYRRKDCFSEDMCTIGEGLLVGDADSGREWNYTTKTGKSVLIVRSPSDWRAWLFCDGKETFISVMVEARFEGYSDDLDGNLYVDVKEMTDRQLEQLAETIDFTVEPKVLEEGVDLTTGEVSTGPTQNGYTLELKSVVTDGEVAYITLGLTAPENVVLSEIGKEGYEQMMPSIYPGNSWDYFVPKSGEMQGSSIKMALEEDGDGLDNTQNLVITAEAYLENGEKPFLKDAKWELYIEDLIASYFDHEEIKRRTLWTTEGLWQIDVTFNEGDFREIEFVQEPIPVSAAVGWGQDGKEVYEDIHITSFALRTYSATMRTDREEAYFNDFPCVVLKDNSQIAFISEHVGVYIAERPIPLDQVAYVLLPDGTKLMVPEEAAQ